jgi:para-aminobenzoate synthetase component 1
MVTGTHSDHKQTPFSSLISEFGLRDGFMAVCCGSSTIFFIEPAEKLLLKGNAEAKFRAIEEFEQSGPGLIAGALFYELFDKNTDAPGGVLYRYNAAKVSANDEVQVKQQQHIAIEHLVESFSNFPKREYLKAIHKIKEEIQQGRVYQVNLSHQVSLPLKAEPRTLFNKIHFSSQGGRRAYLYAVLEDGPQAFVSASPEKFFSVKDSLIVCNPIKGTRPRGASLEDDLRLREELIKSEKDRAELAMVVDVVRNDLSKITEAGTVNVLQHARCESYPTVHHLVSDVSGKLLPEMTLGKTLKALFPFASITGAPKDSAIRYIREMEKCRRGIYTGAIGWWGNKTDPAIPSAHFNIAIRTATVTPALVTFGIGGGITANSDPESEYHETLTKAEALLAQL